MTTPASTVINRVLRGFQDRGQVDVLSSDMTVGVTTLEYTGFLSSLGPGARVELGSEIMLVTEDDTTNKKATVVRGWLDTTPVAHSNGDPIMVSPRIFRTDILDLFNDCLEDLFGSDLFAVGSQTFTYDPGLIGYTLDAEAIEILRVDALKDDSAKYWEPVGDWLEVDNADTGDFSTGKGIMLRTALPPGEFRVIYAKPFTRLADENADLEDDAGLRPYMIDLPFYYAMNRLMVDLERHRSQIQGAENHQRAQDAPPFLALRTGEWYQARYRDRILTARSHLKRETQKVRITAYGS